LPAGFEEDDAGGDGDVEGFHWRTQRDAEAMIRLGDELIGEARSLAAEKQKNRSSEVDGVEVLAASGAGGDDLEAA
jgi:hypothetical protein